jgi:outer membrane biogenesis lipoprotein LolB
MRHTLTVVAAAVLLAATASASRAADAPGTPTLHQSVEQAYPQLD